MKWQIPPKSKKYNLVATFRIDNEIYLTMINHDGTLNLKWEEVPRLQDEDLKSYLLGLKTEIESGLFDADLLQKELNLH